MNELEIKTVLESYVTNKQHVGIVWGLTKSKVRTLSSLGRSSIVNNKSLSQEHLFEAGSITKILIGLLFSQLHIKRKISIEDSIGNYLQDIQNQDIQKITIKELLSHTSGLPRLPSNLKPSNQFDPYADFTIQSFKQDIESIKIENKEYCYSNLGFALLGMILQEISKTTLEDLLSKEIFTPLKMLNSFLDINDPRMSLMSKGHLNSETSQIFWNLNLFEAAGGLKSNANDLLNLIEAILYPNETSLNEAIQFMIRSGIVWNISKSKNYIFHEGGTYGFRSLIVISHTTKEGLLILSNTGTSIDEIYNLFMNEA